MRLTFLGTSAANAYPESFCRCDNCEGARRQGGPSLRKRSSALLNTDLLFDLGPDIHAASQIHSVSLSSVQFCLQTHAHADHLDPSHLLSRSPAYGVTGAPRLHFYASTGTLNAMAQTLARDCGLEGLFTPATGERLNLALHTVQPFTPFQAGPYRVTAFPAEHDREVESMLYAVQEQDNAVFYGTDTAVIDEETWQAFHRLGLHFDLVILDHTYGPSLPASDHLNAALVTEYAARLRREGLLTASGRVFATHIAHEDNPPHAVSAAYAAAHGYEVAYDGLVITI